MVIGKCKVAWKRKWTTEQKNAKKATLLLLPFKWATFIHKMIAVFANPNRTFEITHSLVKM